MVHSARRQDSTGVGVDGCRAGWIAIYARSGLLRYSVYATFSELVTDLRWAERVFVDIPIGLPSHALPIRPCDQSARSVLGFPRRNSVFPVPCRAAAYAPTVQAARSANTLELGRSLTAQTWGICSKIAEVDTWFEDGSRAQGVREVHPEVCFWALAGGRPMHHAKRSGAGQAERLALLEQWEPSARTLLRMALDETQRKAVRPDDVLDALVAFVTANSRSELSVLGNSATDERGLPMEMVHVAPNTGPRTV